MNKVLGYGWIICFIIAYLIQVIVPMTITFADDINREMVFVELIAWILSIAGFIIFIIWLTRFNDRKVLNIMWIVSLIIWIISIGIIIFMVGNVSSKALIPPSYLIGYSFTIFIGTLIGYLVRSK